ncbi:MAG: hypothetical protein KY432_08065, partial [Acidobacteria bacterium]|nr:hypothetical protein [Acidobacteriota bacterium]
MPIQADECTPVIDVHLHWSSLRAGKVAGRAGRISRAMAWVNSGRWSKYLGRALDSLRSLGMTRVSANGRARLLPSRKNRCR